jgi:flagellar hook-associated protein FlgK
MYHALAYATHVFNILPVRGLTDTQEVPSTPHQLFFGVKPSNHLSLGPAYSVVLPVPGTIIDNAGLYQVSGQTNGKQTERGIRGIFIGFSLNQKGFLICSPGSRRILVSADVIFDENFYAAIATTWQQHHDSLALQPVSSYIPDATLCLEHTGTVEDNPTLPSRPVEEGNELDEQSDVEEENGHKRSDVEEGNEHFTDDDNDCAVPPPEYTTLHNPEPNAAADTPMVVDDSNPLRRSSCIRRPVQKYAGLAQTVTWSDQDIDLAEALIELANSKRYVCKRKENICRERHV